jgi:hypothetical protein
MRPTQPSSHKRMKIRKKKAVKDLVFDFCLLLLSRFSVFFWFREELCGTKDHEFIIGKSNMKIEIENKEVKSSLFLKAYLSFIFYF